MLHVLIKIYIVSIQEAPSSTSAFWDSSFSESFFTLKDTYKLTNTIILLFHGTGKVVYYSGIVDPLPTNRKKPFRKGWHARPKHHK